MKKYAALTFERSTQAQLADAGTNQAAKGWHDINEAKDYAARTVNNRKNEVEVDVYELKTSAVVPPPKVDWDDAK